LTLLPVPLVLLLLLLLSPANPLEWKKEDVLHVRLFLLP
jgi:hypothetical protein